MLPALHRLTDADSFRQAARSGRRASSRTLVVHLWAGSGDLPPRVGFVVSKAVGNAVVRNRVKRRLRAMMRDQLAALPAASLVVVRALPRAASASSSELRADLDRCLNGARA